MVHLLEGSAGGHVATVVDDGVFAAQLGALLNGQPKGKILRDTGDGVQVLDRLVEGAWLHQDLRALRFEHLDELLLVRKLRYKLIALVVQRHHRRKADTKAHMFLIKLRKRHHGDIELREAHAMAHVGDPALPRLHHHVLPERRLIVQAMLMEGEVPVPVMLRLHVLELLRRVLHIVELVLLRVLAAPCIVEPDIVAGVDEAECDGVLAVEDPAAGGVADAVLAYYYGLAAGGVTDRAGVVE